MTLRERFRAKVALADVNECWTWIGARSPYGYGRIYVKGRVEQAHRVAWELTYGAVPDGLIVCHRCDNPPCVNPRHLFLGTLSDNTQDMIRKGRNVPPRGERSGRARLDERTVRKARAMARSGLGPREIARCIGAPYATVHHAISGYSWKHLEGTECPSS